MSFKQQSTIQWFKYPLYSDSKYVYMALKDYATELKEGIISFRCNGYKYFGFEVPFTKHNKKILDLLEKELWGLDGGAIPLAEALQEYKNFKKRSK